MSMTLPSYTSGTSEVPLLGMTIGAMLDRTAEKYPDTEALVALHQDIRWTYKEFVEKVNEAARAFMAIGFEFGANRRRAPILPDNRAVNRFSGFPVPDHRGFPLIGNADTRQGRSIQP